MAMNQMNEFVQYLRRTVLLRDGAALTGGQLLGCFIEHRDDAAFAALVRRHGPMVWGVCRRLLNQHDAEDAFQATFLVLVRKTASIVPRERVAHWLYGVAHQTALQARRTVARRTARERQVLEMPEPAITEQDLWRDLQLLLDQELSRLADTYREVIILSDLEGKTRKEVARQLGLPEGTVASRLARARTMLAKRLARHGLAVSVGALAAVLSQKALSAGVPTSVLCSTIKATGLFAAGQAATAGVISVKVAALTEGVLKTMLLTTLKTTTAVLLAVGVLSTPVQLPLSIDPSSLQRSIGSSSRVWRAKQLPLSIDPSSLQRVSPLATAVQLPLSIDPSSLQRVSPLSTAVQLPLSIEPSSLQRVSPLSLELTPALRVQLPPPFSIDPCSLQRVQKDQC